MTPLGMDAVGRRARARVRLTLLGLLLAAPATPALAARARIQILARDVSSHAPLGFFRANTVGEKYGVLCDSTGSAGFTVPPGTYRVRVVLLGYRDTTCIVRCSSAKVETLLVELRSNAPPVKPVKVDSAQSGGQ